MFLCCTKIMNIWLKFYEMLFHEIQKSKNEFILLNV